MALENVAELVQVSPVDTAGRMLELIPILKAIGVVAVIYVVYMVIMGVVTYRKMKQMESIEKRINIIDGKLDKLLKKKG